MIRLLAARFFQSIVVMILVYTATFWMLMAVPGDPFVGEKHPPQGVIDALNERYHLNGPKYKVFAYYAWYAMKGDFGRSILHEDQTVLSAIKDGLPCSIAIGALAIFLALWMGMALGTLSAITKGGVRDSILAVLTLFGISVPLFVVAAALLYVFAVRFRIVTELGWPHIALPVATLAIYYLAAISRLTRVSVIEQLSLDYVRTARAKGLSFPRAITRHVLRNATLPVLSYLGPAAADALTGSFVVEKVFSIPGMGRAFVDACLGRDLPLVLGCVIVFTAIILVFNFIIDVTYALADPRISMA